MSVKCSYAASASQLSCWYGHSGAELDYDENNEPTAADHGDVLYDIGKSDRVGRFMVARRKISPGEVVFTDQPAVIGPDNAALPMCLVCYKKLSGAYKDLLHKYLPFCPLKFKSVRFAANSPIIEISPNILTLGFSVTGATGPSVGTPAGTARSTPWSVSSSRRETPRLTSEASGNPTGYTMPYSLFVFLS